MKKTPPLLDPETFALSATAEDDRYGYHPHWPVSVGGYEDMEGPMNERRVLNALLGPKGEKVNYSRTGSLPAKGIQNCLHPEAILDHYLVWWEGSGRTYSLYFNIYEQGEIIAPKGFSYRTEGLFFKNGQITEEGQREFRRDEWGFWEEPNDF